MGDADGGIDEQGEESILRNTVQQREDLEAREFAAKEFLSGPRLWKEYHSIEKIGEGNFGVVFKATNDLDGQVYAIKKTTKPITSDADLQHRLQEVYALVELTSGSGRLPYIHQPSKPTSSTSAGSNPPAPVATTLVSEGAQYVLRYYDSWIEELEEGGAAAVDFGETPVRGGGSRAMTGNEAQDECGMDGMDGCAICIRMEYVNGGNLDKRAFTIRDPLREVCVGFPTPSNSFENLNGSSSSVSGGSALGEKRSLRSKSHDWGEDVRCKSRRQEGGQSSHPDRVTEAGRDHSTPVLAPAARALAGSRSPSPDSYVRQINLPPPCTPPQCQGPRTPQLSSSACDSPSTTAQSVSALVPFLRLLPERVVELIFHMASALQMIHQRMGMVHLDVKPDNIFCNLTDPSPPPSPLKPGDAPTQHPRQTIVYKLGDFGLARRIHSVSATGEMFKGANDDEGDRRYLCPYLLGGKSPLMLEAADVFSLGKSILNLIVPEYSEEMDRRFRHLVAVLPTSAMAEGGGEQGGSASSATPATAELLLEVLLGQCLPRTQVDALACGCPLVASDVASVVASRSSPNSASPLSDTASSSFRPTADVPNGVRLWPAIDEFDHIETTREAVLEPLAKMIAAMVDPNPRSRPTTLHIMTEAYRLLNRLSKGSIIKEALSTATEEDATLDEAAVRIANKSDVISELEEEVQQMMALLEAGGSAINIQ